MGKIVLKPTTVEPYKFLIFHSVIFPSSVAQLQNPLICIWLSRRTECASVHPCLWTRVLADVCAESHADSDDASVADASRGHCLLSVPGFCVICWNTAPNSLSVLILQCVGRIGIQHLATSSSSYCSPS